MRWIWIDRFIEFRPRELARAVKHWSMAEDVFNEHFPGYPIVPASLLLEGLAQTGGILVGEANEIPKAYFHFDAVAGQELVYEAKLIQLRDEGAMVAGTIHAETSLLAEAEIYFAHLDQSRSQQIFGDRNFVFSGELKNLLGLAKMTAQSTPRPEP
jgi:3-hydroxyacyl-[acyl-carrier-protein] dehydratase